MLNENNCLFINPNIAIIDDDLNYSHDLKLMLPQNFSITTFNCPKEAISKIDKSYSNFLILMQKIYISIEEKNTLKIKQLFSTLCKSPPITVALIDLNLNHSNEFEGYTISENLQKYHTKRIIFTGNNIDQNDVNMINNGITNAYINKLEDTQENLIPCIEKLNNDFYQNFYNESHYFILNKNQHRPTKKIKNSKNQFMYFANETVILE